MKKADIAGKTDIAVICPFCNHSEMVAKVLEHTCSACKNKIDSILDGSKDTGQGRIYILKEENILDFSEFHLAHIPEKISINQYFKRIQHRINKDDLPLECKIYMTKWATDDHEYRPRIIVNLRDHLWSSVRIITGIDYMGNWGTFKLTLVDDPEFIIIPQKKEVPKPLFNYPLVIQLLAFAIILFGIYEYSNGLSYTLAYSGSGCLLFLLSIWLLPYYFKQKDEILNKITEITKETSEDVSQYVKKIKDIAMKRQKSFKLEDMRLFCTAMRSILEAYFELLLQEGSMMVKEVDGKGGFFGKR